MTNKITLITPPDIYENSNTSILFIGITEQEQDVASEWLAKNDKGMDLNLYYYQGENNLEWLLYALSRSDATFLNLDCNLAIINIMGSYILGKSRVYYKTDEANLKALMSYINEQSVPSVEAFLEKVLNEQR